MKKVGRYHRGNDLYIISQKDSMTGVALSSEVPVLGSAIDLLPLVVHLPRLIIARGVVIETVMAE
jgi:hypothetical protein